MSELKGSCAIYKWKYVLHAITLHVIIAAARRKTEVTEVLKHLCGLCFSCFFIANYSKIPFV